MEVIMPQLGETVTEGTVAAWHKHVGDRIEVDEPLLDVETDKAATEVVAPCAGTLAEIRVEAGTTVDVGVVLAVIESAGSSGSGAPSSPPSERTSATEGTVAASTVSAAPARAHSVRRSVTEKGEAPLSPAVRRLFREHELSARDIAGTGRDGRITKKDVLEYLTTRSERSPAPLRGEREPVSISDSAPQMVRPFNRIRKLTAEHMVRSKATSPHVLQAVEVDFSGVERVRHARRDAWRLAHGHALTYLPFIAQATCSALREFPHLNARVEGDTLVLQPDVHLGIAVNLDLDGLVAPVVHSAQELSVSGMARHIHELSQRARKGQLKPDELSGGTYTISNSGTFGTLITAPIINQPQVAILSVDGVRKRPWVIEDPAGDSLGIRPVGILAQSFDHRAVDGAYSAAFLAHVKELLETRDWNDAF
jgi:pyruvate dehydrogenase E2 component (dihydrolipoamide acetyltransferase)